jgi:hypothetical protein
MGPAIRLESPNQTFSPGIYPPIPDGDEGETFQGHQQRLKGEYFESSRLSGKDFNRSMGKLGSK